MRVSGSTLSFIVTLSLLGCFSRGASEAETAGLETYKDWKAPVLGDQFSKQWHDGNAEIGAYKLTINRYGESRSGEAVAIFVTEPFSLTDRVKIEGGSDKDTLGTNRAEVLKLNLVRDFPTGIYDYNTMLSSFLTSQESPGGAAGTALKVTFSAQEWCGHAFETLLPRGRTIAHESRSYFGNEGDRTAFHMAPTGTILADALFHWARGYAAPLLQPGESVAVKLYPSLLELRFGHKKGEFKQATMSVSSSTEALQWGGKPTETYRKSVTTADGVSYTFWVAAAAPHQIIKWVFAGAPGADETAELLGMDRLPYWNLKDSDSRKQLESLGLKRLPNP